MGFQVTEVQKSLKGFDYPGSPEGLARHAEANGGDSDLVEALRSMQKTSFDGPNAVMHSLSEDDVLGGSTSVELGRFGAEKHRAEEHSAMSDITQLILDDHETFRREFAALDDADGPERLREIWEPLAALLEVHAAAEEAIFYPTLLRRGEDGEDETLDAIGDHNDIRDGVREAGRHPIGTPQWWNGVRQARQANSSHMAEEEDDALPDFRRNAALSVRVDLGHEFLKFKTDHSDARDLDTSDKDPQGYVDAVAAQTSADDGSGSLGIGSLKGR